ncbi:MAG: transthyretin-like family protein [Candidatus Acidiferrales bacterium]
MWTKLFPFLALLLAATTARAQETPPEVSVCDLASHPKSYDGKMIRVRGTLNVEFEDFTLSVKNCDTQQQIWLAFGGDVPGIVASMVNDNFRIQGTDLKVNGVSYGIAKDENFRKLYALIAARHGDKPSYRVTATLTGAFLAGKERQLSNGKSDFGGYGHIGCCSLFVITKVSDVESVPPAKLNVRGIVLGLDGKPLEGFLVFDDVLGGSPPLRQRAITDEKGRFQFSNSGQLLRIEDPRYRPLALAVEPGSSTVRVRLEDASRSDWKLSPCSQADSDSRVGFTILFRLPTTMESSPFDNDGVHTLFIFPHGSSAPEAELILSNFADSGTTLGAADSSSGTQRWIKDGPGKVIGIDARGGARRVGSWRNTLFFPYDEAGYRLQKGEPKTNLDRIIDSACIK